MLKAEAISAWITPGWIDLLRRRCTGRPSRSLRLRDRAAARPASSRSPRRGAPPAPPAAAARAGRGRLLRLANQRARSRCTLPSSRSALSAPCVGALAEAAQRFAVRAAQDDLFADVGARRRGEHERRRWQQRAPAGASRLWRRAILIDRSRNATNGRGRARALPAPARSPRAQASWLKRRHVLRARRAQPRAQRAVARPARSIAPRQRGARRRPARPGRCRRRAPGRPAAAPTASLAITASPWFIASLTTKPHGSRKVRVAIEGTTSTSQAA